MRHATLHPSRRLECKRIELRAFRALSPERDRKRVRTVIVQDTLGWRSGHELRARA